MRHLSVCSGIEAATVAWHSLGWQPVAFSEIEAFPSAVLAHHYPNVPNWGDMTLFHEWPDADVDVLVGGTPCQSFSVAGLRKGLADPRGNLALTYLAIAKRYRPRWVVWENVPGVLSSDEGRALGAFLGGLAELRYGFAWRVLDAQYAGLAQRRKRVFVVGHLGDWRRAAAVLFDTASLRGDPAPRREARQGTAPSLAARTRGGGGLGTDAECDGALIAHSVKARPHSSHREDSDTYIAHALRAEGFDATEDGTGRGIPLVADDVVGCMEHQDHGGISTQAALSGYIQPVAFDCKRNASDSATDDLAPTLKGMGHDKSHANAGGQLAVAFDARQSDVIQYGDKTGPLDTDGHTMAVAVDVYNGKVDGETTATVNAGIGKQNSAGAQIMAAAQVRRLTPRECERLQGFPDDYTLIPYRNKLAADGPRYKALGNSMAVPVMHWIGWRIQLVESLLLETEQVKVA